MQLWRLEIEKDLAITDIFNHIVFIQGLIYNILVDDQLKCENLNKSSSVSFLFTLVPKLKIPIPPRGPKSIIQAFVLSSSNTSLGLSLHGRLYAFQIQNTPQHLLELYLSQEQNRPISTPRRQPRAIKGTKCAISGQHFAVGQAIPTLKQKHQSL